MLMIKNSFFANTTITKELSIYFAITILFLLLITVMLIYLILLKKKKHWWTIKKKSHMRLISSSEKRMLASVLAETITKLSEDKTGALITIERKISLNDYADLGVKIDSELSKQLIETIFYKGTPLHDGAVIIKLGRVECASAYFPLTNKKISSQYGSRHRAALGISELNDSLSIVVSETTGGVSIARSGKFIQIENLNNFARTLYDELASTKEMINQN